MKITADVLPYIGQLTELVRHWDDGVEVKDELFHSEVEAFLKESGRIFLAVDGDELMGYASLHISTEPLFGKRCELQQLLVHPNQRRKGVATELMEACNAFAAENECRTIWLSSRVHLEEAHQFYLSKGYQEVRCSKFFERPVVDRASSLFASVGSLHDRAN